MKEEPGVMPPRAHSFLLGLSLCFHLGTPVCFLGSTKRVFAFRRHPVLMSTAESNSMCPDFVSRSLPVILSSCIANRSVVGSLMGLHCLELGPNFRSSIVIASSYINNT
ncbi:uncharacterized protein CC84DRAFT_800969 [Paraphaeosphaeria sporulosa]|uniref:Uncharacterized protein n=1 Tax=Paraphaeosphaeria sporulosa TaxID=1460663 RepID=A0A177CBJ2_9PLEO|nr:uncharacterized protein CC84DRAFT_800969 [Paraphaeosphaeria sporulosa]OAG04706.1 hypothetical protein CC84DRAFT_800969 [Paraphaeosphaeria sporulosa]